MWMIDPSLLCRNHLLGEHNEIHKAIGGLLKGRSIRGYLERKQLAPQLFRERHEELVIEMERRGYNHNSPLPDSYPTPYGEIDLMGNLEDLSGRCPKCKERICEAGRLRI